MGCGRLERERTMLGRGDQGNGKGDGGGKSLAEVCNQRKNNGVKPTQNVQLVRWPKISTEGNRKYAGNGVHWRKGGNETRKRRRRGAPRAAMNGKLDVRGASRRSHILHSPLPRGGDHNERSGGRKTWGVGVPRGQRIVASNRSKRDGSDLKWMSWLVHVIGETGVKVKVDFKG